VAAISGQVDGVGDGGQRTDVERDRAQDAVA
jgi:hypothetical protein